MVFRVALNKGIKMLSFEGYGQWRERDRDREREKERIGKRFNKGI